MALADEEVMIGEDGRRMRRRRKCIAADPGAARPPARHTPTTALLKEGESEDEFESLQEQKERMMRRECPIPKPGGKVGEMLGFKPSKGELEDGKGTSRPP